MLEAADARPGVLGPAVTAVRLRTGVHRYAMRVLEALGHPPLMDPALHVGVRTIAPGLDPVRVLVFGGGLAVGYGVASRDDAFDGPLARRIAGATGRGAVVENRAVRHVTLPQTARSIGPAGTQNLQVAVWCPSFADGMERLQLSSWRSELHAMVRALRQEQRIPLVLTHMPVPAGHHPAAVIARPWVHRLNRVISRVAEECEDVSAVETEPFVPAEIGAPITDAAYFAAVAARIAPAVVAALGVPTPTR
jgi:hypothetical protein